MNERLTENIVRKHFESDPLFSSVKFEEQKSTNIKINECLSCASKNGKGIGRPEFIISFPSQSMEYIIIIECKASVGHHESQNHNNPKAYAVDGVLHYSNFLANDFNVISIAVSGDEKSSILVSQFYQKKGSKDLQIINEQSLLRIYDYITFYKNEQMNFNIKDVNIIDKAVFLNELFHSCSVSEGMRNTLVSGILLALQNETFKMSYKYAGSSQELAHSLLSALDNVLTRAEVRKKDAMMGVYTGILNEPLIKESNIKKMNKDVSSVELLKYIVNFLEEQVYPLMRYEDSGYDILGRFYTEFIRYAASKQKQGLVLTPSHITELFCDLARIKVDDVVFDPCCGTGGFLIAAMKKMLSLAGNNNEVKNEIRKNQLLGIELRPEMFTFACSNMMLRGDGKSNLDCGDCFSEITLKHIRKGKPTVSFLNPPYDHGTADQLRFIENALNVVSPQNGRVVAIVQMSCAIKDDPETNAVRQRILDNHSLVSVISMPDELFYPVGVVTCIMVFDSNRPNGNNMTWFGYLKNDGYVKRKNKGRIDYNSLWKDIRIKFVNSFLQKSEIPGLSVMRNVKFNDEWCAEAYMQTDYLPLQKSNDSFENSVRAYLTFLLYNERHDLISKNRIIESTPKLNILEWKQYKLSDLFRITGTKTTSIEDLTRFGAGKYPYVTTQATNNGVSGYFDYYTEIGNVLTIDSAVVGYCSYQKDNFSASDHVEKLTPNFDLNVYTGLFISAIINLENYRFSYGRKFSQKRIKDAHISLPTNSKNEPDYQFMEIYMRSLPYSNYL